jgi:Tfp pilus assembly PilM family ATPase
MKFLVFILLLLFNISFSFSQINLKKNERSIYKDSTKISNDKFYIIFNPYKNKQITIYCDSITKKTNIITQPANIRKKEK